MKSVLVAVVLMARVMTIVALSAARVHHQDPKSVDGWFTKLPQGKPKFTELTIYIHAIIGGDHPSVVVVAQANGTSSSPTEFGLFRVIDDQLTQEPEMNMSRSVGRFEGFHISASKETTSYLTGGTFVFTKGKYSGSTLTVHGRLTKAPSNVEYPVSGGTGYFGLAQGIVMVKVVQPPVDAQGQGHQILEYRFNLVHFPIH